MASIHLANLLLSTQRALLGAIGEDVLSICVNVGDDEIELVVFTKNQLSEDECEALGDAITEMIADLPDIAPIRLRIIENASPPFRSHGYWVFLRFGYTVSK